jgi:hypothetical protein
VQALQSTQSVSASVQFPPKGGRLYTCFGNGSRYFLAHWLHSVSFSHKFACRSVGGERDFQHSNGQNTTMCGLNTTFMSLNRGFVLT